MLWLISALASKKDMSHRIIDQKDDASTTSFPFQRISIIILRSHQFHHPRIEQELWIFTSILTSLNNAPKYSISGNILQTFSPRQTAITKPCQLYDRVGELACIFDISCIVLLGWLISFPLPWLQAKLIEFNPLRTTDVHLPQSAVFVVCNSLTEHNKAATRNFNTRVTECRLAAQVDNP